MKHLLLAFSIAFLWALWPILSKYTKGYFAFAWISIGSAFIVAILQYAFDKPAAGGIELNPWVSIVLPLALGLLNGLAFYLYPKLLGAVTNPGVWVGVVTASMTVFSVLIDAVMRRQLSLKDTVALCIICIGIYVLQKN